MPPNQDWTSNGKHIEQNQCPQLLCVLLVQRIYAIDLAHDATVGERSNNSKKFLHVTKINLGDTSNEREGVHLHTLEDRGAEALQERG